MRRFTSFYVHTAHFGQHTDITLKDVPDREYTLRLFIENVERELQRKEHRTWTPAQRQYVPDFPNTYAHQCICVYRDVSLTSQIRVDVLKKTGHSVWARHREASRVIDLQDLSNDYWNPEIHNFTVPGQSLSLTAHAQPLIEKDRAHYHRKA